MTFFAYLFISSVDNINIGLIYTFYAAWLLERVEFVFQICDNSFKYFEVFLNHTGIQQKDTIIESTVTGCAFV